MNEPSFSTLNVYQMAERHGGPGFWITRTTWGSTVARIVGIAPATAPAPYFGSPPVVMDVYSTSGTLKDELARLSTAGTYKTWRKIIAPEWATTTQLRSLDDPAVAAALAKLNRRNNRDTTNDAAKLFLEVAYDRKNEAKAIGAKWDAANRKWWIKVNDAAVLAKARILGFAPAEES